MRGLRRQSLCPRLAPRLGVCRRTRSWRVHRSQHLEKLLEAMGVVVLEVNILQAAKSKGNFTFFINDRDDGLLFLKSERDFINDVRGCDRRRRENHNQARTTFQGILDGAVPALAGSNV